jgi:histone H3/H4
MSSNPGSSGLPTTAGGSAPAFGSDKPKKKAVPKKATGAGTKAKAPKKPSAPRPKRPPSGSSALSGGGGSGGGPKRTTAAQADSILADAATAQLNLAKQRSQAALRRLDPFWYKIEDVLAASSAAAASIQQDSVAMSKSSGLSSTFLPEQVAIVERALGHASLTTAQVTPQAMACLVEQARRFAQELVASAQDYAYTAGRPEVAVADLVLAQELSASAFTSSSSAALSSFGITTSSMVATQLPKLNLVAQQVNRNPLPPIPTHCYTGVVLPSKPHALTARTWDVVSAAHTRQKMVQPFPSAPTSNSSVAAAAPQQQQQQQTNVPGYGAARSRVQIPIVLKPQSSATSGTPSSSSTPTARQAPSGGGGAQPMDTSPATTTTTPSSMQLGGL